MPKKLDTDLKRYHNGVRERVDKAIVEFRASLEKSQVDLSNSTAKQRKEVLIAAGKFFVSLLLKHYASKMKGPWKGSYDQLAAGQKKAIDVIAVKTNGMGELMLDAARSKQVELADALKPYTEGAIEALSWAIGSLSKGLVEAAKGGTDTSLAYLEYKPDVDFASQKSNSGAPRSTSLSRTRQMRRLRRSTPQNAQSIRPAGPDIPDHCGT